MGLVGQKDWLLGAVAVLIAAATIVGCGSKSSSPPASATDSASHCADFPRGGAEGAVRDDPLIFL
jgi:hypothetical protein